MTRVLHTGDTHLGYRQYHLPARCEDFTDAFQQVADDAVADNVDAVVHAGDLFHDRQPTLTDIMGAIEVLGTLADADIPFLGIVGNHEGKRNRQWLDLFETMGLATRLGSEPFVVGDVAFYGLDFVPRSQRKHLDYEFGPVDTTYAALVSHGLFEPFDHGDWDARHVLDEATVEFDALLLGDDHTPRKKRLEEPHEAWLTYCGSTERASASERDERGYNLVTFEGSVDIRRRGLDTRRFVFVDLELRDGEGSGQVRERLAEHDLTDAVVVVTITGDGDEVFAADIEAYAEERGALTTRVNDRRELTDETDFDVTFADPDRAVRERIGDLGLSPAARDLDETIRASKVADSNVTETVEKRVSEFVEDDDVSVFEPAPADESAGDADTEGSADNAEAENTAVRAETEEQAVTVSDDESAVGASDDSSTEGDGDGQATMEEYR